MCFLCLSFVQTNTYQAAIVTDHLITYPLFTYVCGQMEWSATRSGKHAVVGYNGYGNALYNHPASGFDVIIDEIACYKSSNKRWTQTKRNGGVFPFMSQNELPTSHRKCIMLSQEYKGILNELTRVRSIISPCPPSIRQAVDDDRFMLQPDTNCYVSTFFEEVIRPQGVTYTVTKQCCYSSR